MNTPREDMLVGMQIAGSVLYDMVGKLMSTQDDEVALTCLYAIEAVVNSAIKSAKKALPEN